MTARTLIMAISVVMIGSGLVPAPSDGQTDCKKACESQVKQCRRACEDCRPVDDPCHADSECCSPATCQVFGQPAPSPGCFHACYEGYCYNGCPPDFDVEQACALECQPKCANPQDGSGSSVKNGKRKRECRKDCENRIIVECCGAFGFCTSCSPSGAFVGTSK
jgi:hypothetical protein